MRISDWSSDVCSSDLANLNQGSIQWLLGLVDAVHDSAQVRQRFANQPILSACLLAMQRIKQRSTDMIVAVAGNPAALCLRAGVERRTVPSSEERRGGEEGGSWWSMWGSDEH